MLCCLNQKLLDTLEDMGFIDEKEKMRMVSLQFRRNGGVLEYPVQHTSRRTTSKKKSSTESHRSNSGPDLSGFNLKCMCVVVHII